jgi:prepilin-type N-terminal cleavage/methylation domain-containing protein
MKDAARSCHTSPLDFGHLTPTFSPLGAEREKTPVTPHVSRFKFHVSGFTLIELLVVIAIMAALAALLLPVARAVKKHQYIYNAQAELAKLETAIDRYKAAYGFYPPDNHLTNSAAQALVNQLYYELVGTTNNAATGADPNYHPLDGQGQDLSGANVSQAFGVGGFMNCGKSGGGEDASVAKDFLPDLKQRQIGVVTNSAGGGGNAVGVTVLITAVGGPDTTYQPLGAQDLNPWRYISSNPTNNPGSYDLWVLLSIGATTNLNTHTYGPLYLICNWSKSVQVVNSPVP